MREDREFCKPFGTLLENGNCPSNEAFKSAIADGRLSENPNDPNYAGNYMYMGYRYGKHQFKNKDTRRYDV